MKFEILQVSKYECPVFAMVGLKFSHKNLFPSDTVFWAMYIHSFKTRFN